MSTIYGHVHKNEIVGNNRIHCSHHLVCGLYKHVCAQQNSVASLTLGGHALSVATATYGSPLVHVPKHMNMEPTRQTK